MSSYEQQELIKSTELLEAYHVNLIPSQGREEAVQTIARYTPNSSDCFASLDQNGQWLKTSQGYSQLTLDGSPEEFLEPLPKNGMMRGGKLYSVPSLGELIKEKDCSLRQLGNKNQEILPTPKYTDKNTAGVKTHKQGQQKHLSVAIRQAIARINPNYSTDGYLDAAFVEEMMGFPRNWSDDRIPTKNIANPDLLTSDRLEHSLLLALIPSNFQANKIRLGQIGNAIVPQMAAVMFDLLTEILTNGHPQAPSSQDGEGLTNLQRMGVEHGEETSPFPPDETPLDIVANLLFPKAESENSNKSENSKVSKILDSNLSGLSELENYKKIISSGAEGVKSFEEIGTALIRIRDRSLYKLEGYKSFIVFCQDNFELTKARIYQLIDATKLIEELKKSKILDSNLNGLSESHCKELRKIKDKELRSLVLNKVNHSGKITAKTIANTYREMKLKEINQKYKPDLPPFGSVVRVTSKHDPLCKEYNGYWGIVRQKYEFTVDIDVLGAKISTVNPQDFIFLKDADEEFCQKLLTRLNNIYTHPKINDTAKVVLRAIATRPYPLLEEMDECLLNCIEDCL